MQSGLGDVPAYAREGAVLPMLPYSAAIKHGSASRAFDPLTFVVYAPRASGGGAAVFEDDGLSTDAAHVEIAMAYRFFLCLITPLCFYLCGVLYGGCMGEHM